MKTEVKATGFAGEWAELCNSAGWCEAEQVLQLEGFLSENGLWDKFLKYAQLAAASEARESALVRAGAEEGVDLAIKFDIWNEITSVVKADTCETIRLNSQGMDSLKKGVAYRMEVRYPNASRHGVPIEASREGGSNWARRMGYLIDEGFDVWAKDSGNDEPMVVSLMVRVRKECLVGGD